MPRFLVSALVVLGTLLAASAGALAEGRFALVIGNSQYRTATALPNPARDARAVSRMLEEAGFEVTPAFDLSQSAMSRTLRDFAARYADEGEETVVLVYYAGHGVQIDGENYLVPVDADIQRESDVALEGVRFADVMNTIDSLRSRTRIVLLDACRNNPFAALAAKTGHGLALVNAPSGSLVAYSTSPGATAEDGEGGNSPFTTALIKAAKEPGTPIEQALKEVRLAVHAATEGRQVPWEVSSLTAPFSFFPGRDGAKQEAVAEKSDAEWHEELEKLPPRRAFEVALREDKVVVYRQVLVLYRSEPFAERVRGLLERRLEMMAWFDAVTRDTAAAYAAFLDRYPRSDLAPTARRLQQRARARSAMARALPGTLGLGAATDAGQPQVRTIVKEVRVPSPPQIKTVIREVPVVKTVIKEVPVVRTVIKRVPVVRTVIKKVPEVRTVVKTVRVPTRCRGDDVRGPRIRIGPPRTFGGFPRRGFPRSRHFR